MRVYLGAAPGVGKTYAMLAEGHRRAARGTDVVIAYLETHGRQATQQQAGGLEMVPRARVHHNGRTFEEMDLPAVLRRAPAVALVDELAHTNVGPAAHAKRWQDVEQLLAAGISVITTVNIQHLESLNDVVEAITGVRQAETVPDRVVRQADQIELVDMSPQALRKRMSHGNIYAPDKIDIALNRFFREGNLAALRELTLLWLADHVDDAMERYRDQHAIEASWPTRERIVVGVTGGPESEALMRRAARIVSRSRSGEWLAVYVTHGDGLADADPDRIRRLDALAHDLGGRLRTVVAEDTATAILQCARAENASQVLIGASRRGRLSTLIRPGIGEVVIAESGDIDVHIVTHDQARQSPRPARQAPDLGRRRRVAGFALGTAGPFVAAAVTAWLHEGPTSANVSIEAMVFMSLVVVTALVGGRWPAIACSLLSGFALNYFFSPPLRMITIASGTNAVAVVLFVLVGVAVSSVVGIAARRSAQAEQALAEADALAALSHSLMRSGDYESLLRSACDLLSMESASICDEDGRVVHQHGPQVGEPDVDLAVDDQWRLLLAGRVLSAHDLRLAKAFAAHIAVMAERQRAAAERHERLLLAETDKTRSAVLAAVSHDLRSPLAAVKAAVSSLRSPDIRWSAHDQGELLAAIESGADRLDALISNLLDMSRVQAGAVVAHHHRVDVAQVIASATTGLDGVERINIRLAPDARQWCGDAGLLERVLANLISNALTYAPGPIEVTAQTTDKQAIEVAVIDHGPGVDPAHVERLFVPFQRLGDVPQGTGVGIGLAVAKGLTEAMGGHLDVRATPGGGLTMAVVLPVTESAA